MALSKATIEANCNTLTASFLNGDIASSDVKTDSVLLTALANLQAQLQELLANAGVAPHFRTIDVNH